MKSELKYINELKKLPPNTKVRVYYEDKEGRGVKPVNKPKQEKMTLAKLAELVNARIDNLEHNINARLDYIVKANNLKDLSNK